MPGACCTRGLACNMCREYAHEHTGTVGASRHSPHNGFTAYAALSPATNSSCHRRRWIKVLRARLDSQHLRRLDTSNGCQDHTVLPYAATRLRQEASPGFGAVRPARRYRSRETRPAIPFAPDAAASTASHPNVSDDPDTPLAGDETAGFLPVIWGKREEEYFLITGLTGQITLKALSNFLSTAGARSWTAMGFAKGFSSSRVPRRAKRAGTCSESRALCCCIPGSTLNVLIARATSRETG
jgi:hypothetical protein